MSSPSNNPSSGLPWNKKKKSSLANTPAELTRPQNRRSRSAQSIYSKNQKLGAYTIPEDDPVSHSTVPSLPKFTSIGSSSNLPADNAAAAATADSGTTTTGLGIGGAPPSPSGSFSSLSATNSNRRSYQHVQPQPQQQSGSSLPGLSDDKRRQRAKSIERDATAFLTSNIGNDYDDIGVDQSGDEDEDLANNTRANTQANKNPDIASSNVNNNTATNDTESPKKKREVVFYDSESDSSSSHAKEKEKITDDDEEQTYRRNKESRGQDSSTSTSSSDNQRKSAKNTQTSNNPNAEVTSINSDSGAGNFLAKLLNFKHSHSHKKKGANDEEKDIENNGFELNLFSLDHPTKYLKRIGLNHSLDEEDANDEVDSEEERENIRMEVENIMSSHTSKLGRFFHKRNKSVASSSNKRGSSGPGQLSTSSSKTSLSDLFYSSYDPTKANGAIVNNNAMEDEHPDEVMKDRLSDDEYVPPPRRVQDGVLSTLMKMYNMPQAGASSATMLDDSTLHSGAPNKAMHSGENMPYSPDGLDDEIEKTGRYPRRPSEESLKRHGTSPSQDKLKPSGGLFFNELPSFKPSMTPQKKAQLKSKANRKKLEARITVHLADLLQRKNFILKMCTALMIYGAPPHRLEEYMVMTSRVLEIDGQFMYFPGCMIVAFNDPTTKTTEMQLVRTKEGVNLSKLHDAHQIYKAVIHDMMGVDDASRNLDILMDSKPLYPPWICVLLYGYGSAMVCPFAFNGNWADMPVCFIIGCCVGFLQFYVSPRSAMYSNVFEVAASIVVSFLGRALGSINGGRTFCFSALVQGSLALILPGFIILTGSLELQSRNIVNGAVRMFYAIIYSLFLSFGITIGAAIYGWFDHNATSNQTCVYNKAISPWFRFLFVPMFALVLSLINQASWKQLPTMVSIACVGYVVSYFSSLHFSNSSEFTSALAAMVIGVFGNLYSRFFKGLAISAMLPAIFVQVPSGIASQSSLLAGLSSANEIVSSLNGTASSASTTSSEDSSNSLSFGFSMIQVAIGISVGLFTASILVYPFGKKKTALFTL